MADAAANRLAIRADRALGRDLCGTPPPAVLAIQQRTGLTWQDRQALDGKLHQAGVLIASGADAGISDGKPHGVPPLAITDLIAGGISAADALASATSLAARAGRRAWRSGRGG